MTHNLENINTAGWDSEDGIVTRYGLDVSGFELNGEGEILHAHPDRPRGPPSLEYNEYRASLLGVKRSEVVLTTHPDLALRLKKGKRFTSKAPNPYCGLL